MSRAQLWGRERVHPALAAGVPGRPRPREESAGSAWRISRGEEKAPRTWQWGSCGALVGARLSGKGLPVTTVAVLICTAPYGSCELPAGEEMPGGRFHFGPVLDLFFFLFFFLAGPGARASGARQAPSHTPALNSFNRHLQLVRSMAGRQGETSHPWKGLRTLKLSSGTP